VVVIQNRRVRGSPGVVRWPVRGNALERHECRKVTVHHHGTVRGGGAVPHRPNWGTLSTVTVRGGGGGAQRLKSAGSGNEIRFHWERPEELAAWGVECGKRMFNSVSAESTSRCAGERVVGVVRETRTRQRA